MGLQNRRKNNCRARTAGPKGEKNGEIGFIGVGNMGGPMAQNLIKDGHDVKAFDVVGQTLSRVVNAGAHRPQAGAPPVVVQW